MSDQAAGRAMRPARMSVASALTWDLDSLFPRPHDWVAALAAADALALEAASFSGRLGSSASSLLAFLRLSERLDKITHQVHWFAHNRLAEDQADPERQAPADRSTALIARVQAATAFFEPELLALPEGTIEGFLDGNLELAVYRLFLTDVLARRPHLLGREAEEVLAAMSELFAAPYDIWRNTTNADIRFDAVTDERGVQVPMSLAALGSLLQSPSREVRRAAYGSAARAFEAHKRTIAATFAAAQKRDVLTARARRYPSALAAALDAVHLPETLFTTLVAVAEQGVGPFHRYLRFRQRELGLARLMPYDLQAPLDEDAPQDTSIEEACQTVRAALAPLGPEYASVLERAFDERWIDWAENAGKRSGAYSYACYGYHPVILINWQGKLRDTFTLAHELGHAVHSTFTTQTQPFIYAHYTTFLAEMASTTNELLLAAHLLASSHDRAVRRAVLTRVLSTFTANFYGGSSMAAHQLAVHAMVENRQVLTYESITEANTEILRRWYGDSVEVTPEGMGCGWMRAQHNFMNFYSYQYASGIAAAAAFSDAILHEGRPAVDRYLRFLRSGASAHSVDLLAEAGVDMTTPAPLERAVAVFDSLVAELEAL